MALLLLISLASLNQGKELVNYYSQWEAKRTAEEIAEARKKEGISDMVVANSPKEQYPDEIMKKIDRLERIEKSGIELKPEAYFELGLAAYNREEYRKAVKNLNIAAKLNETYLDAYNLLGLSHYFLGHLDSSLLLFEKGLDLAEAQRLVAWQADLLHNIASFYYERGEVRVAVEYIRESLRRHRPDSKGDLSVSFSNLAVAFTDLGVEDSASYYYDTALVLTGNGNFEVKSSIYSNKAWFFEQKGMLDSAIVYFEKAKNSDKKHNLKSSKAATFAGLGFVYYLRNELGKSDTLINKALALDRKVGYRSGEARDLRFLALIYAKKHNKPKALQFIQQALKIDTEVGFLISQASDHNVYGDIWIEFGDDEQAKKHYVNSLNLYMQMRMQRKVIELERKLKELI